MRYLSVCSGIEAATVAWHPMGWEPVAFAEIEAFPSAALAHHYPSVPNWGDMTRYRDWPDAAVDLVVGGTPCQSFSVAGLRQGLADPRGNLALTFLGLVDRYRPCWVVWENVSGVRSADDGQALGAFLGGLGELGYGWAYRSLDAQYFGLAQRRERVFVVGYSGDWRPPTGVLFELESLSGDSPPRRETGERVAPTVEGRAGRSGETGFHTSGGLVQVAPTIPSRPIGGGGLGTDFDCDGGIVQVSQPLRGQANASHRADSDSYIPMLSPALKARDHKGPSSDGDGDGAPIITHSLRADGFDASEDGTGRGTPLVIDLQQITSATNRHQPGPVAPTLHERGSVYAIQERAVSENPDNGPDGAGFREGIAYTMEARNKVQAVAMNLRGRDGGAMPEMDDIASVRAASGGSSRSYVAAAAVRRLTPRECERLQGFPDDYTLVPYRGKPAKDSPRYKALGNSMAVPCMRWIGERIALVESVLAEVAA